jgi:hypothetical protein
MHAYRSTLFILALTFTAISVIVAPIIIQYRDRPLMADGETHTENGVKEAEVGYASLSIGNLGYSTVNCKSIPLN